MTAVNILGRLRIATEQVRAVQATLSHEGNRPGITDQVEILDSVGKELDGMCARRVSDRRIAILFFFYPRNSVQSRRNPLR